MAIDRGRWAAAWMWLVILAAGATPAFPDETINGVVYEEGWIQDRYGDDLYAEFHFPARDGARVAGRFPVILTFNYGTAADDASGPTAATIAIAKAGYVQVTLRWTGVAPSDGNDFLATTRMQRSTYDAVEWLAGFLPDGTPSPAAEWSSGSVGTNGASGNGLAQLALIKAQPPHLFAMIVTVAPTSLYHDMFYRGGMRTSVDYALGTALAMHTQAYCAMVRTDPAQIEHMIGCYEKRIDYLGLVPELQPLTWWQHPTYDAYWEERSADLSMVNVPTFLLGSWDDYFTAGTTRAFTDSATDDKLLVMGLGGHSVGQNFDTTGETIRWFDRWLKKGPKRRRPTDLGPRFRYFLQQANVWKTASDFPIPGTRFTDLHLAAPAAVGLDAGVLVESVPPSAAISYAYNPTQGRTAGQLGLTRQSRLGRGPAGTPALAGYHDPTAPADQRLESADSLTFVGEPLASDTEVTGPVTMTLYASSTASDTDWVVKLFDVFPDDGPVDPSRPEPGYRYLVTTGWLKGTHRKDHVRPIPIPVGETVAYEVSLYPTSYLFQEGHRIGVQIASADAARALPNRNPAVNTVMIGGDEASRIILPIIDPD